MNRRYLSLFYKFRGPTFQMPFECLKLASNIFTFVLKVWRHTLLVLCDVVALLMNGFPFAKTMKLYHRTVRLSDVINRIVSTIQREVWNESIQVVSVDNGNDSLFIQYHFSSTSFKLYHS